MQLSAAVMIAACALAATAAAASPPAGPSPAPEPAAPVVARPAAPAAATARPVYQPVEFGRLVAELPIGAQWLDLELGPFCIKRDERSVDAGRKEIVIAGARDKFREEIVRAGLKVSGGDSLFESSSAAPSADFVASGVVIAMHEELCTPSAWVPSQQHGQISMMVEWRLYSRERKEVVATARVSVNQSVGARTNAGEALLNDAFVEAVRRMANDPAIRRALAVQPAAAVQQALLPKAQPSIALTGSLTAAPHGVNVEADSVVLISAGNGMGSGFLVSKDGYLLTDQHVVGDAATVKIRWSDGVETEGVVVRQDKGRDVALLKTDPRGHAPLPLRKDVPVRGDTIFAIGAPLDEQFQGTVMRGVISASRVIRGYDMLQGDANVNHGMSGGPVLDDGGRVVALVEAGIQPHDYVSVGINYFTPIGDALRYLSLTPQ